MNSNVQLVKTALRYTFGIVPIVAGLDKFLNLLTDWGQYLAPGVARILPMEAASFMMLVGLIEIAAGVLVLVKPKVGATLVMSWLVAISLTLLFSGNFIDIAVRDLVMAVGAFSLMMLSEEDA